MRLPAANDLCWIDGQERRVGEASVGIDDLTVHAGVGLFETIALRDGRPLELAAHLERLFRGAARLDLSLPSRNSLEATVLEAAGTTPRACGWLKIVVTSQGRSFVFRGAMDPAEEGRPVAAILLPWRRNPDDPLAGLKTLNYAANWMGLAYARRRGADEGLWRSTRGLLTEGCTSNLFVVGGRKLFTPAVREGILPGVVRDLAITAAGRLGIPLHEGKVRVVRLERADEAFVTSSLRGVRPLVRFEGRPVRGGSVGPVTRRIAEEVSRIRREENRNPAAERRTT